VQARLGADIQMQLDVCRRGTRRARRRGRRVAHHAVGEARARDAAPSDQALFGIVQGACSRTYASLSRRARGARVARGGFDGLALGGFSVGEPIAQMYETLGEVAHRLDAERPRYLMGVGTPRDLVEAIEHGVDICSNCVLPTRNARNGQALTRHRTHRAQAGALPRGPAPIDDAVRVRACASGFSRAYLRHLYLAGEILVLRLLSLHNLHYYGELVAAAREAIVANGYAAFKKAAIDGWSEGAV